MNFLTVLMKEDEDGIYALLADFLARGTVSNDKGKWDRAPKKSSFLFEQ